MSALVRGSTIHFAAICTDASGAPASPTEATLHLAFAPADGSHTRTHQIVALAVSGSLVAGRWDSSVASAAMPVHWHIRTSGSEAVAADGSFRLEAAEANPAGPVAAVPS